MSNSLVNYSFLTLILASFVYVVNNFTSRQSLKRLFGYTGTIALVAGLALMSSAILLRWQEAQRPPFSNMYESLILFSWAIILIYLVLEFVYKVRLVGAPAAILALTAIAAASFFNNTIEPLVPALKSNWLTYHVITCFIGYAAFAISAGVSLVYLSLKVSGKIGNGKDASERFSNLKRELQSFNYESIRFGFLFLGVGIITGAVWANEAWGTYWSWDVKETWSLITWIVYAIIIHFKYVSGRFGIKDLNTFTAFASIIGFIAVIFTYFGVNFLLAGLHSYA
jgi:cytochrome c-type biogenesis protein CcsB